MAELEDDDWEYEYDDHDTESFYVPVDLSNVPEAQEPVYTLPKLGHPTLLKSRLRALNATRRETDNATDSVGAQESATMGEAQIIGLHTANPLIMYNGQLLSCRWTSTIGTDLFFAKPSSDAERDKSLRSLPAVDLIGIGSAKLIARAGRLRPRDDLFGDMAADSGQSSTDRIGNSNSSQTAAEQTHLSQVLQPTVQAEPGAPTTFLAKLNQAKARRGETSRLVMSESSDGLRLVSQEVVQEPVVATDDRSSTQEDVVMEGT